MGLWLALKLPAGAHSWLSSSCAGRRAVFSFLLGTAASGRTTLTARLRAEARRPVVGARPPCLMRDRNSSPSRAATAHNIELCSLPTIGWEMRQQICCSASMTRELPTRDFGGAATTRRTQSRRVTPTAGKRRTTTKSPGRRREESKEATRGREPPSPAGKGAGRPVAWLAYSNSRPSDSSTPCSDHRHELVDEFMPKEDPPPFASILLAPEK